LLATSLGRRSTVVVVVACLAVLVTMGSLNAYLAGIAKLGSALGPDGGAPVSGSRQCRAGEVPRRSLAVTTVLAGVTLLCALV
jgi:amino acid efflux transporter